MASLVTPLASLDEWKDFQTSAGPGCLIAVYFHAPWAKPCEVMAEGIETLAREISESNTGSTASVRFTSVHAEEAVDISTEFEIESVPYTVLVRDGQNVAEVSGGNIVRLRDAITNFQSSSKSAAIATSGSALPPSQSVTPLDPVDPSAAVPAAATAPADSATQAKTAVPADGEESEEELFKQLEALVNVSPVMLFMKGTPSAPECGFSRQIVEKLRDKNIRYGFFNILANQRVREGLKKYADWPTYPQLWVQGELVGGLDIVKEEFNTNEDFMSEYRVPAQEA